jgi:outer membrane murein-binding lipoprotein Lpp
MLTLVNIMIFFFIFLIGYQLILANQPIIEGVSNYKDYDDPTIKAYNLSVQNAGNISYLKERVDKVDQMDREVNDLKRRVDTLETQMEQLSISNNEMAQSLPGVGEPVAEETPAGELAEEEEI